MEIDPGRSQTVGRWWLTLISPKLFRSITPSLSSKAEPSSFPCTSKLRECLDCLRSRNGFSDQVGIIWKVHSLTWPVNYVGETGVKIMDNCVCWAYVLIPNPSLSTSDPVVMISWSCSTILNISPWRWGSVGGRKSCWNPDSWMAMWKLGILNSNLSRFV